MSRRKQRSAFYQVSKFDRGRIVAYRDCELSFNSYDTVYSRVVCPGKTSIAWSTLDAELQTSPPPMGGIGYHSRTPLVRIAGTLNSQRYISEVLEPVVLSYLQGLATATFQQDNARPYVAHIVQRFFVNHLIELLPRAPRSPDL
ncbi:transposable element Tcb1 transposase [Trichonephila clavipes]|nr:transposable element Tcb1 transposase [Trichonephila clavipes]